MNRIVLIGNGFDLAHGMRTSYKDFLTNYWGNIISEIKKTITGTVFENEDIRIESSPGNRLNATTYQDLLNFLQLANVNLEFKNVFLGNISNKLNQNNWNWVDVENEYYGLLKTRYKSGRWNPNYTVEELNKDFKRIKELLADYLKIIEDNFDNQTHKVIELKRIIGDKIYEPYNFRDFSADFIDGYVDFQYKLLKKDLDALEEDFITIEDVGEDRWKLLHKIQGENVKSKIRKIITSSSSLNYFDFIPNETLFLNFNYTSTEKLYFNPKEFYNPKEKTYTKISVNHIHGTTDKYDNNPIIFGFGDEIDKDYTEIEELNDNNYLENIKSINYLETNNYRELLKFINSDRFQVIIMGHSCGISDRTLLNTLFEHNNCGSIKAYFHQKSEEEDNFSDIIRNISRNFNDKVKMRDKVVNKMYCEKLS